jgi:hypothetical protein
LPKPPKPGSPAFPDWLDENRAKQKAYSRRRALWNRKIGRPFTDDLDIEPGTVDAGFDGDG